MNAFRSMLPVLIATTKGKLQIAQSLQTRVRYIVIATRLYKKTKLVSLEKNSNLYFDDIRSFTFEIMGLNVSQPRGTKFKYVHASNYEDRRRNSEENEEFLSGSSKREEAGFFQFKSRNGKANCTFDRLDTLDSRKSVPFAALPDTTRASKSSLSRDKEDLHSIFSDEVTTRKASCKNRVLFTDEVPTEGMEQDGVFNENSAEGF